MRRLERSRPQPGRVRGPEGREAATRCVRGVRTNGTRGPTSWPTFRSPSLHSRRGAACAAITFAPGFGQRQFAKVAVRDQARCAIRSLLSIDHFLLNCTVLLDCTGGIAVGFGLLIHFQKPSVSTCDRSTEKASEPELERKKIDERPAELARGGVRFAWRDVLQLRGLYVAKRRGHTSNAQALHESIIVRRESLLHQAGEVRLRGATRDRGRKYRSKAFAQYA